MSWSVNVNGRHSSPYNSMDSTADRQRQILIESFALELKIERCLVAAAHALDKQGQKTVSAFKVGTPRYLNLSQLSTGSPFAKHVNSHAVSTSSHKFTSCSTASPIFPSHFFACEIS